MKEEREDKRDFNLSEEEYRKFLLYSKSLEKFKVDSKRRRVRDKLILKKAIKENIKVSEKEIDEELEKMKK